MFKYILACVYIQYLKKYLFYIFYKHFLIFFLKRLTTRQTLSRRVSSFDFD